VFETAPQYNSESREERKKLRAKVGSNQVFSILGTTYYSPPQTSVLFAAGVPAILMVDGIQVHKVVTVSQSKSGNAWIYSTVCTLATLGARSPGVPAISAEWIAERHRREGAGTAEVSHCSLIEAV
jgi:hypothetical protein